MPKVKTNSSVKKRFKLTGTGKVKRHKAYTSHLLTKKATKRKRHLRKSTTIHSANEKMIKRLMGLR